MSAPSGRPRASLPPVGGRVPAFSGTTGDGRTVTDAELRGRPAVLYFYPKASSVGCTIEAREFARHHAEFEAAGVRVIGLSVDAPAAQSRFSADCSLPFDLVADASGEISRRFGVLGRLGVARRTTFLLDPDGTIVEVVRSWRPLLHVQRALARFGRGAGEVGPSQPPAPR